MHVSHIYGKYISQQIGTGIYDICVYIYIYYIYIYYTSDRLYKCNRLRPGSKAPLNAVHAECLKFMPIQGAIEKVFGSVLCHFCEGTTSA